MHAVARSSAREATPADAPLASTAPLIAVIAPLNYPDHTNETYDLIVKFARRALHTLANLGARTLFIDPAADDFPLTCPSVDGLLLLGGGDVDPALYRHNDHVPSLYGVDRRCDDRTVKLIYTALNQDVPIFGICRGLQLINVMYGGTLIPDLGPESGHYGIPGSQSLLIDERVHIEKDSNLAHILGRSSALVRHGHHQAVGQIAPSFRVAARTADGVIEAIEHEDPDIWVLGVQWHPEDIDNAVDDTETALFAAFLARARYVCSRRYQRYGE